MSFHQEFSRAGGWNREGAYPTPTALESNPVRLDKAYKPNLTPAQEQQKMADEQQIHREARDALRRLEVKYQENQVLTDEQRIPRATREALLLDHPPMAGFTDTTPARVYGKYENEELS